MVPWATQRVHTHTRHTLPTPHTPPLPPPPQALKDTIRALQSQLNGCAAREASLARQLDSALMASAGLNVEYLRNVSAGD